MLKILKWNIGVEKIPRRAIIEITLVENHDFNSLKILAEQIQDYFLLTDKKSLKLR